MRYNVIQCDTMWYNVIQCDTMQYNAIQCNTMWYNAIQCDTMRYNVIQCNTMRYNAIQCDTMRYNAIQCDTMRYNAIQCDTMQYNAIQCDTMWYNAIHKSGLDPRRRVHPAAQLRVQRPHRPRQAHLRARPRPLLHLPGQPDHAPVQRDRRLDRVLQTAANRSLWGNRTFQKVVQWGFRVYGETKCLA
jgi:hypothetical protein